MSGVIGNKNSVGNSGGKTLQDRQLAADVRNLALSKIKDILERPVAQMSDREYTFYDAVLLKLASTVLPRLTEITGEGGGSIPLQIIGMQIIDESNPKPNQSDVKVSVKKPETDKSS